jgi:hypothetical protein
LQQSTQVYFKIAGIDTKRFFSRPFAEAARLEIVKELLAQVGNEALELTADRSFVNPKNSRDLEKCLAIEKVRSEQKAVFWEKTLERSSDRIGKASEFCGERRRGRLRRGNVERIERRLPMDAAVVIDVSLSKRCAEPAE